MLLQLIFVILSRQGQLFGMHFSSCSSHTKWVWWIRWNLCISEKNLWVLQSSYWGGWYLWIGRGEDCISILYVCLHSYWKVSSTRLCPRWRSPRPPPHGSPQTLRDDMRLGSALVRAPLTVDKWEGPTKGKYKLQLKGVVFLTFFRHCLSILRKVIYDVQ